MAAKKKVTKKATKKKATKKKATKKKATAKKKTAKKKSVRSAATRAPSPKWLEKTIKGESYYTALAQLLACDERNKIYLFRALNSNYFVQHDKDETIKLLDEFKAERLYFELPIKLESNVEAAFPRAHGGIDMATATRFDD
jgi:chromosome segregation ATPase